MTLETRLREYLQEERDTVPSRPDALDDVLQRGRRRRFVRRAGTALAAAAAIVTVIAGTALLLPGDGAPPANSPTTTAAPTTTVAREIAQATLAPVPETAPDGTDLTFVPVDQPTADDLAAIEETIELEGHTVPRIVSLGEVPGYDTRLYFIHDLPSDRLSLVVVGPDYPSFSVHTGPYGQQTWEPSWSRDDVMMRLPDILDVSYVQVEVAGETVWQRPAGGFVWIPVDTGSDQEVVVTGYDVSGRQFLERTLPIR